MSREGTFRACRRRYYYDYYLSWRGWERDAPEARRRAYLLKKMTRLPMLAGDALHRALEEWFGSRRRGRELDPASVEQRAVTFLREGYRTSRDGKWRERPSKLTHLAEHHYGEARIDERDGSAAEYGGRYVERIRRAVRTFFEHPELREVREADPTTYLALEQMGTIELAGVQTYAIPDFAFRDRDGRVVIYDWKSGAPREVDRFQLAVYTLYAGEVWGSAPEKVLCVDAYLPSGEFVRARHSAQDLEPVMARIEASVREMAALHFDADREEGDPERFPPLEPEQGASECAVCNYRELCGRT